MKSGSVQENPAELYNITTFLNYRKREASSGISVHRVSRRTEERIIICHLQVTDWPVYRYTP